MAELEYVRKLDRHNRVTIPGEVLDKVGPSTHFAVEEVEGRIVLSPVKIEE